MGLLDTSKEAGGEWRQETGDDQGPRQEASISPGAKLLMKTDACEVSLPLKWSEEGKVLMRCLRNACARSWQFRYREDGMGKRIRRRLSSWGALVLDQNTFRPERGNDQPLVCFFFFFSTFNDSDA